MKIVFVQAKLVICLSDKTSVYPINEQCAAKCVYSVSVFTPSEHVALQASYFSCHTDRKVRTNGIQNSLGLFMHTICCILFYWIFQEDVVFKFNLIVTPKGKAVTYAQRGHL